MNRAQRRAEKFGAKREAKRQTKREKTPVLDLDAQMVSLRAALGDALKIVESLGIPSKELQGNVMYMVWRARNGCGEGPSENIREFVLSTIATNEMIVCMCNASGLIAAYRKLGSDFANELADNLEKRLAPNQVPIMVTASDTDRFLIRTMQWLPLGQGGVA
jgi:hypothetical protein